MSELEHTGLRSGLLAEDLYTVEAYFARRGGLEFVYDEELDVFRFPKTGASPSVVCSPIGSGWKSEGTWTSENYPFHAPG